MMSKTSALEHEIASGSPFAPAFQLALDLRLEGSAATFAHVDELRTNFFNVAPPASRLLAALLAAPTGPINRP